VAGGRNGLSDAAVPPQGVWPREQRRKPADGSESYWSPGYSLAGTFGKLEAPWPLCEVIASLSIIVAGQIQQTLPDKRIGFVGEFSYVPSPLLVELMVQFSLTTRALAVVPSCFRPISQHSFQRIELVALKTAQFSKTSTALQAARLVHLSLPLLRKAGQ
jgi:hypothetical protein